MVLTARLTVATERERVRHGRSRRRGPRFSTSTSDVLILGASDLKGQEMARDAIGEYLAVSKKATVQTPTGAEALTAAVHQRWAVKTGADADAAALVGQAPMATTIASMRALAVPAVLPPEGRSQGAEETVWQLDATLTGYKLESDGDYHLVIADGQGNTMIAEIPDPSQLAQGSFFGSQIAIARQAFDAHFGIKAPAGGPAQAAAPAAPSAAPASGAAPAAGQAAALPALVQASEEVTLVGLGFFDFAHGQDGVAPNAIELHPVINIQFHGKSS